MKSLAVLPAEERALYWRSYSELAVFCHADVFVTKQRPRLVRNQGLSCLSP